MECFRKMQISLARFFLIVATMMLGTTSITYAAGELPYTFSPGQTISAAQVNANFQALSTQIAALKVQLTPVPIVGTYDYFILGLGLSIDNPSETDSFFGITHDTHRGTIIFAADGTVSINVTGAKNSMEIDNNARVRQPMNERTSLISGTVRTSDPTLIFTGNYTVSGSTVTVNTTVGFGFVGTLSTDGRLFIGMDTSDKQGINIGIKRQ